MNYLAVNTADKLEVLLSIRGELHYFCREDKTLASKELLPAIEKITNSVNFDLKELDFVAAVVGPGSFTGIRIGICTVNALSYALKIPAIGLTYFDYIAQSCQNLEKTVVIDGGGGVSYIQNFPPNSHVSEPVCIKNTDIAEKSYKNILHSGDFLPSKEAFDRAVLEAFRAKRSHGFYDVEPIYLRRAQAERVEGEL